MSFLRRLFSNWAGYFRREHEMGEVNKLASRDPLARFLVSSNHFAKAKDHVKASAFMPAQDLTLSVFQIKGLAEREIWTTGKKHVSEPRGRTLYGRADILVGNVREAGLRIDPDDKPPRHANIVDWPEDKPRQKLLALDLASKAALVLV